MNFTIKKKPTNVKTAKSSNSKTIQFLSAKGVKKVFDVHRYNKKGILYFKRKNKTAIA